MSEGTCDVNMFDNPGIVFKPPEKLRKKLEEAMKFKFDEVFEKKGDGQFSCKLDPEYINDENEKYQFTLHKCLDQISNEHRRILDEWCKAFLAKEYQMGNDIHPGCFTLEQRQVNEPNNFGWEYMLVPNDQEFGVRVKWNPIDTAPKDGTEILLWNSENPEEILIGKWDHGFYSDDYKMDATHWMKIPLPPIPKWSQLGWCCENLYNSTKQEYSMDSGYPENAPVLMGDDNSLFIGKIQERIKVCPWCGNEVNKDGK